MQTIAIRTRTHQVAVAQQQPSFITWFNQLDERAERNRFGITAALILLQVTIAGFNVVIPPMIGASVWLMAPGVFLAFMTNAFAMAQMKMKWVILASLISVVVNAGISIYCLALM